CLLGHDRELALVALLVTSALQPVLQPLLALALLGIELDIRITQLMIRLGLFIGGAFAVAFFVYMLAGRARLERVAGPVSGVAVLMLIVFGIGVVDGLTETVLARPGHALTFLLAAFAANFGLQIAGGLVFLGLARAGVVGRRQALTTALATGNRNLAILIAVLGDSAAP